MASLHATQKEKFATEPEMAAAQRKAIKDLSEHYYEVFETKKYQYRV